MKKILFFAETQCITSLLLAIFIGIIIPNKAHAIDITLGGTTWYAQSEQYYTQNKSAAGSINNSIAKSDPAFLFGPTLAVRFNNDFNLTFVFLYGNFENEKNQGGGRSSSTKFSRSDSDLALNYRLSQYFKAFAGIKYLSYGITPAKTDYVSFQVKNVDIHKSYGPGIGLSATIPVSPVSENLFVLGTVSGLYLWGSHSASITDINGYSNPRNTDLKYNEYGFNSTLSLAYYITPASIVISLGGRFQYLIADYNKNPIYLDSVKFTIFGATLTATYNFSI